MQLENIGRFALFACAVLINGCSWWGAASVKNESSGDVYLQLGVRYLNLNKLEIARENLELALKHNPDSTEGHTALAYLYEKIGKLAEAGSEYEKAMALAPEDLSVQNNFGRFLCDHKQYEKGMALLTQAGNNILNEKRWMAMTNAGRCQLGMGQKRQAEAYFREALAMNNSYAPALQEMQKISYDNADFWAAKGFLQRYLEVAAHTPETLWFAVQTERKLGNLQIAQEYQKLLLERFPLSNQAKQLGPVLQ